MWCGHTVVVLSVANSEIVANFGLNGSLCSSTAELGRASQDSSQRNVQKHLNISQFYLLSQGIDGGSLWCLIGWRWNCCRSDQRQTNLN